MIIKAKGIQDKFDICNPNALGGMKSPEYLKLINPLGKIPALITTEGDNIPESDTIARYVLEKYPSLPSFIPANISLKYLSEKLCRIHDIYISCIQGAMYKAPGTSFSTFGSDRIAALNELKKQLNIIEEELNSYENKHPEIKGRLGPFLCGSEVSLADATLYPTVVFCMFMLPQFFGWSESDFLGPRLSNWFAHMSSVEYASSIRAEIEEPLNGWKTAGRFVPIMAEMDALKITQI